MLMGNNPNEVMRYNMIHRSSIEARRNIDDLYDKDPTDIDRLKIPENARNRNAESLRSLLKAIGLELYMEDDKINNILEEELNKDKKPVVIKMKRDFKVKIKNDFVLNMKDVPKEENR